MNININGLSLTEVTVNDIKELIREGVIPMPSELPSAPSTQYQKSTRANNGAESKVEAHKKTKTKKNSKHESLDKLNRNYLSNCSPFAEFTIREAACYAGKSSPQTIKNWVKDGLKARKVECPHSPKGFKYLIKKEDLDRYMSNLNSSTKKKSSCSVKLTAAGRKVAASFDVMDPISD